MSQSIGESLSFERFGACRGTGFARIDDDGGTTFSLVAVELLGNVAGVGARPPFALVFAASDGRATEQGNYRLRHPLIGEFDIFLVPIAKGETGLMFEAIFT